MDSSEAGAIMVGEAGCRLHPVNSDKNTCTVDSRTVDEGPTLVGDCVRSRPKKAGVEKMKRRTWLCAALIIFGNGVILTGVVLETSAAESTPEAARIALFIVGGMCCLPPSYYLLYSRPCTRRAIDVY